MITAPLPLDLASSAAPDHESRALFGYEATKGRRFIAGLYGFQSDEGPDVTLAAAIHSVHDPEDSEPQRQFFRLRSREQAQRFADEALTALEYLGCTITEIEESRLRVWADVAPRT